jgi:hypothetical protein
VGHSSELAFCDAFFEVVTPENIFEIFHAVDFVNTFVGADKQANMVPFSGSPGGVEGLAGVWIVCWLI